MSGHAHNLWDQISVHYTSSPVSVGGKTEEGLLVSKCSKIFHLKSNKAVSTSWKTSHTWTTASKQLNPFNPTSDAQLSHILFTKSPGSSCPAQIPGRITRMAKFFKKGPLIMTKFYHYQWSALNHSQALSLISNNYLLISMPKFSDFHIFSQLPWGLPQKEGWV